MQDMALTLTDPIFSACERVARALGLGMRPLGRVMSEASLHDDLATLTQQNGFRYRRVSLKGDWWQFDNGPLLVSYRDNLCAAIPDRKGRYRLYDPREKQPISVTTAIVADISRSAYMFYRALPDRALGWSDILRFALGGNSRDLLRFFVAYVCVSLLGLFIPIASGILFDVIVPNADYSLLVQLMMVLAVNVFIVMFFNVTRVLAMLRIRLRINAGLQAAVWSRVLSLPLRFFRDFSAGDLAVRASAIDQIQQQLTGTVITTILSGVLSFFSIALMYYYDTLLATVAVGLVAIVSMMTCWITWIQLKYQRKVLHHQGKLSGIVLQLLTSISKLRIAAKEPEGFSVWAVHFIKKARYAYRSALIGIRFSVFNRVFSIVSTMLLFWLVVQRGSALSFGSFIAFNAVFSQFFTAILGMIGAFAGILRIIPLYERAKPILEAIPESRSEGIVPDRLRGAVQLTDVSFRYHEDAPLVLQDINVSVKPGEFIALVGASGAGKSTLFRLLLGFEIPLTGSIDFDGQGIAELNSTALRHQLGVVLQNTSLLPGTILENIIGHSTVATLEDAWAAARLVAIAQDIEAMPMGMQTLIDESGRTLSMGQRQRILLARALVHKPAILLLDEATSALDNVAQAEVQASLQQLNITRIVAAHRLSTIQQADRIYVLEAGMLVESGRYDELLAQGGMFSRLAMRQQ